MVPKEPLAINGRGESGQPRLKGWLHPGSNAANAAARIAVAWVSFFFATLVVDSKATAAICAPRAHCRYAEVACADDGEVAAYRAAILRPVVARPSEAGRGA